jgi:hypothetical protein
MKTHAATHRHRRFLLLAACVLPCVILAAGVALAAGGLKYVSKQKTASNVEPGRTFDTAKCPHAKHHVTGGGLRVTGPSEPLELEVGSSLPTARHNGWRGGANNSSAANAQMTTTAICGKGKLVYKSVKKSIAVDEVSQKKARCPKRTKVIGGGVGAPGDHGVEVAASEPSDGSDHNSKPDDAWFGRESNTSTSNTRMTVTAVCAKRGKFRYVHSARASMPNDTQRTVSASCPGSKHVTGGGIDIKGKSGDLEVNSSFPFDSGDAGSTPDNGWRVTGNNDGSGSTTSVRAFAICKT